MRKEKKDRTWYALLKSISRDTACITVHTDNGGETDLDFAYRDIPECRWEAEITEQLGISEVPQSILNKMHREKIKG